MHRIHSTLLNGIVWKLFDIFRRFALAEYATGLWTDFATVREVEDAVNDSCCV